MAVFWWEKFLHNCHTRTIAWPMLMKLTQVNQIKEIQDWWCWIISFFIGYFRTPCVYTTKLGGLGVKYFVAICKRQVLGWMPTLVLACIGAPWSRRISIILPWPFLAAQWRGVSSSCDDKRGRTNVYTNPQVSLMFIILTL